MRDKWGVPHVYAANQADLFFAQGLVQAQDRLFQIDLWRRAAQGRLAEVLGANFIERDAMTRRVQYHGDMDEEWASYGADTRAIADAFVRGINAWVDIVGERPPEEFALAGWRPEHWRPEDLLNRSDAFLASGNASDEVLRARLTAVLGVREVDALTGPVFASSLDVPRPLDVGTIGYVIGDALKAVGTAPFFSGLAAPLPVARLNADPPDRTSLATTQDKGTSQNGVLRDGGAAIGSNAWAIGGERSTTRAPLLAADPHRQLAHPSLRYLVHLNAPGWNVIGAASPWLPGVVVGHNDRVAWAMTSRAADVQDLYVERVNPANPHQVERGGRWVDTTIVAEPIAVKGKAKPFPFERESTTHGVIIASDRERHLRFTLQWMGFAPGTASELAALAIDRAESVDTFRASLERWKLPSATFVFATRDGQIGTEAAGWAPVRAGWNGTLPAPGWTGQYEWRGFRREPRSPVARVVPQSHVVAANASIPRARRIEEVLSSSSSFSVEAFKRLQHDTTAWTASELVPLLASVHSGRVDVENARRRLLDWDRRVAADSAEAALYVVWERSLLHRLVGIRIDPSMVDEVAARASAVLVPAVTKPSRLWFAAQPSRARDELLLAALADAVGIVQMSQTGRPRTWGSLHTALFRHPLGVTVPARRRFNIGPFERDGYAETVMSTGGVDLDQAAGATFGMIADVGDWDRSLAINAPGQSEAPASAHFADLAKLWSRSDYFPFAFTEAAVQANAESTLMLIPR